MDCNDCKYSKLEADEEPCAHCYSYGKFIPKENTTCILDSGERTEYETGAVRDCKSGKGRCDLMPLDVVAEFLRPFDDDAGIAMGRINEFKNNGCVEALYEAMNQGVKTNKAMCELVLEVSKHFEAGAEKYGENNWQKGIPVHSYIDSAVRHYLKYKAGWTDEPHDRAFVWNLMCCIWTMEHKPELDDFTEARKNEDSGN